MTRTALKGKLGTQRALQGHLGTQGTWALRYSKHSSTRRALRHSGTQGTWALKVLWHSGTWALGHSKHLRHFIEQVHILCGHSKSTFVEEKRGGEGLGVIEKRTKTNRGSLKSKQKRTGGEGGGGPSMCVPSLFLKNTEIFKMKFYRYSPVFPVDYNGSMKY